ncbi:MAG: protein kinase [Deltaproteobacteria bacterium]|nr:protein kinase [Deltaproteobacteria bacterium]
MGSFTPPPTTALTPGDRLDRYELLCVLAQGGMGTVWLARQTGKLGFERLVALKTILPTYSSDRQFCDMFLDEAKIAAGIDHENVARILEIGEDRGVLYYAMELIDGESLRKLYRDVRAQKARFPLGVALRVVADACAGLHATHELRDENGELLEVVHRDVSPQNLLLSIRGTTKLIDFGVAKANSRRSEATAAGTLKGKIEYMAPEQARGDPLDRRADVYSMGAVLYELLADRPVRDTDEGRQLVALHELMTGVAYPALPNDVPYVVRAVVDRALARDPQSRFANADELRLALEQAMQATGATATTDDVAALLSTYSRERTAKRKSAIERAMRAATEGRLNAATLVAPVSVHGPTAPPQGGTMAMGPGGPPSAAPFDVTASSSGPWPGLPPGTPRHDGPVTGPSMRTIGPSSLSAPPSTATPRAGLGRVALAVFALIAMGVLGVVAGVILTRHDQKRAAATPVPVPVPVSAEPTSAGGPMEPPPPVIDPSGLGGGEAATGSASPPGSSSAASASAKKDAGGPATNKGGRVGGGRTGGKTGKPSDDEYGF